MLVVNHPNGFHSRAKGALNRAYGAYSLNGDLIGSGLSGRSGLPDATDASREVEDKNFDTYDPSLYQAMSRASEDRTGYPLVQGRYRNSYNGLITDRALAALLQDLKNRYYVGGYYHMKRVDQPQSRGLNTAYGNRAAHALDIYVEPARRGLNNAYGDRAGEGLQAIPELPLARNFAMPIGDSEERVEGYRYLGGLSKSLSRADQPKWRGLNAASEKRAAHGLNRIIPPAPLRGLNNRAAEARIINNHPEGRYRAYNRGYLDTSGHVLG